MKANGTGGFIGTWSKRKFDKREGWLECMADSTFRTNALKELDAVLKKGLPDDDDDD